MSVSKTALPHGQRLCEGLIRRDHEQREALVSALIEGEQSGSSPRTVQEIAAAAKAKLSNGRL